MENLMNKENARRFMTAPHGKGRAYVTFKNTDNGVRFTYRVAKAQKGEGRFFVSLFTGRDNEVDASYTYIGQILNGQFTATKGTKVSTDAPGFKAFALVWQLVNSPWQLPGWLQIWHEGRCGRCGRRLTVPESISVGLGPECMQTMGLKVKTVEKVQAHEHEWFDGEEVNFEGPNGESCYGDWREIDRVWTGYPDQVTIIA